MSAFAPKVSVFSLQHERIHPRTELIWARSERIWPLSVFGLSQGRKQRVYAMARKVEICVLYDPRLEHWILGNGSAALWICNRNMNAVDRPDAILRLQTPILPVMIQFLW